MRVRDRSPAGSFIVQETVHHGPPPRAFHNGQSSYVREVRPSSHNADFSPAGKMGGGSKYTSYQPAGRGGSPLRK